MVLKTSDATALCNSHDDEGQPRASPLADASTSFA